MIFRRISRAPHAPKTTPVRPAPWGGFPLARQDAEILKESLAVSGILSRHMDDVMTVRKDLWPAPWGGFPLVRQDAEILKELLVVSGTLSRHMDDVMTVRKDLWPAPWGGFPPLGDRQHQRQASPRSPSPEIASDTISGGIEKSLWTAAGSSSLEDNRSISL
jgi:hypothetical protein